MFEDSFATPKRDRPPRRDRALGILVTVLFHAVLGFLIYHYRFTVKILPFAKESVRTVVLVPPPNVAIPKVVGGRGLAELPGGPPGVSDQGRTSKPAEEPQPETQAPPEAAGRLGEPGQPPGGGAVPPPGSGSAIPSLSSRFQESISIRGRSSLTIPLAPPGTPPGPPGVGAGAPLPDFSQYTRGAYRGGVGGYATGGRGGGAGGGGGGQRVGMSIALKGYDLLPWATAVIDRIQLNWTLPAVPEIPDKARISTIVVIKKTGELDSIEILEGTSIEALDQAALEALRASLPFPALPEDFPGDLLEITFEFLYND